MQAASQEAMDASIAACIQKTCMGGMSCSGDADSAALGGTEEASKQLVANINSSSGPGGPLQMTNVQVELAQEIASYMKATHSDTDQVRLAVQHFESKSSATKGTFCYS